MHYYCRYTVCKSKWSQVVRLSSATLFHHHLQTRALRILVNNTRQKCLAIQVHYSSCITLFFLKFGRTCWLALTRSSFITRKSSPKHYKHTRTISKQHLPASMFWQSRALFTFLVKHHTVHALQIFFLHFLLNGPIRPVVVCWKKIDFSAVSCRTFRLKDKWTNTAPCQLGLGVLVSNCHYKWNWKKFTKTGQEHLLLKEWQKCSHILCAIGLKGSTSIASVCKRCCHQQKATTVIIIRSNLHYVLDLKAKHLAPVQLILFLSFTYFAG